MNTLSIPIPWHPICSLDDIVNYTGVCALIDGEQVAVFRVDDDAYAISNYDPFSGAYVLSRGLVGDRNDVLSVASPIYKQCFSLHDGQCLDDTSVKLPLYDVQIRDGLIEVRVPP